MLLSAGILLASSFGRVEGKAAVNGNDWYFENWCGHGLKYLDDADCAKKFPSSFARENWSCPVVYDKNTLPEGFDVDKALSEVLVDTNILDSIVTNGAHVCVVMSRRVRDEETKATELMHKYFCAGESSKTEAYETWSSSKIFAIANAAGHLRTNETKCASSNGAIGLDSATTGKHGETPLGDLASIVCSYDTTAGYSSNSLSSYFHDIGFRDRLDGLVVGDWLLGGDAYSGPAQSLGGNYGEATPSDLQFQFTSHDDEVEVCEADKDPWPIMYSNTISALSAAELTRRIVQFRDIPESFRFPGMQWEDAKDELYGAEESLLFPGLKWGGMSADPAIFLQSALNMTQVEEDSQGQFRIFSKLGAGWSTSRYKGEIVSNAYACLPVLDSDGTPVPNQGLEFTVHVRGSIPNDPMLVEVQQQVYDAMLATVSAAVDHKLV